MKGGCAAMIEAFLCLREAGFGRLPVALCLVVGEEENGDGAAQLVKAYHFPWAVVGEPTDLIPCFRSYGYIECQLTTIGKRKHASLASPLKNPIETMFAKMLLVSQYIAENQSSLVYNIRDLNSNPAGFAVPDRCEAWLDIHVPPSTAMGEIIADLEELLIRHSPDVSEIEINFKTATIEAGYEIPEKGPTVNTLKSVYDRHQLPWQTDAFRSHSDANQLWAAGIKPILMGPGKLEQAHTEDESVSFEQVCLSARIYYDFILQLFQESYVITPG
jgi:acetylornithine deacetylase